MPTSIKPEYSRWDDCAVRYTDDEARVLVNGKWRQIEPVFACIKAKRLTKQVYFDAFGPVPPLPKTAFHSPPVRARPPSYGYDDGYPVRFTHDEAWACYADGKWREISKTESLYKVGVLTEQQYLRSFAPLPPLPDIAFARDPYWQRAQRAKRRTSGWRSPLV
jgi:hypothetical protein